MINFFYTLFFFTLTNFLVSQTKVDTLFFGSKKYPIQKTKIYRTSSQRGPVVLPSEYKELSNPHNLSFKYKAVNDTTFEVYEDDEGNEITVAVLSHYNEKPYFDSICYLSSLADTVILNVEEFRTIRPYIKSSNKLLYFCASNMDRVYHDTITIASHSYLTSGSIFSFWQPYKEWTESEIAKLKMTSFVLRDLYYTKGTSTYYLPRKFIIKIN